MKLVCRCSHACCVIWCKSPWPICCSTTRFTMCSRIATEWDLCSPHSIPFNSTLWRFSIGRLLGLTTITCKTPFHQTVKAKNNARCWDGKYSSGRETTLRRTLRATLTSISLYLQYTIGDHSARAVLKHWWISRVNLQADVDLGAADAPRGFLLLINQTSHWSSKLRNFS